MYLTCICLFAVLALNWISTYTLLVVYRDANSIDPIIAIVNVPSVSDQLFHVTMIDNPAMYFYHLENVPREFG